MADDFSDLETLKTWTKHTTRILSSTWEWHAGTCRYTGLLKDAVSHIRDRWKSVWGQHALLSDLLDIFISEGKKEKCPSFWPGLLLPFDWCVLMEPFLMPLQTPQRQIFFDSWTKLEFPSSLHLAQRETTLKSISFHFPKDRLHRDDICLLFILRLMWIFIKNRLPAYVSSRSGTQALWLTRLTHHLYCQRRKVFISFICCLLSFAIWIRSVDKISADFFWLPLACLTYSTLQIQL